MFLASLALTACASQDTTPLVPSMPATSSPAPSAPYPYPDATANAIENDEVLLIFATATAENGSRLSLETQVHLAIPFDDIAGQTLPKGMMDDCGAELTTNILRDQAWSFTRSNTSAVAAVGSPGVWPTESRIDVHPSGLEAYVAGRGMFDSDPTTGNLACRQGKYFVGPGNGGLAVGIPGDAVNDATRFTRWANQDYGYTTSSGVTISECRFEVTDLGRQYGGGSASWRLVSDASNCIVGGSD